MRVLMVSDVYFPRINGVSTSILTVVAELGRLGHEVTLVVPDYPAGEGRETGRVIRIRSRRVPFDPEDRMMHYREAMSRLEEFPPGAFDLVHIQTPFVAHYIGRDFAGKRGLPVLVSYHTWFEEYLFHYLPLLPRGASRALARRFSRAQCNEVDSIVVPSRAMGRVLRRYGVRKPLHIVPTGIDPDRFGPEAGGSGQRFRERHGIPGDRPVALFVGRVAFEKNIDFLLHVVDAARARVPDILLVVAGEGPALRHLRKLAATLGLEHSVLFAGYFDDDRDLRDCYRAGDAFVFASRTETQGLVLLEAMALGVPVVSTEVMGTRDILGAGKGALVAQPEVGAFAESLVALLADRDLRERLSAEAVDYAAQWSAHALTRRLAGAYDELACSADRTPDADTVQETVE